MHFKYLPAVFYSAPGADVGGGPAPQPTPSDAQPGAPGQGGGQGDGFRQTYFPNVPDDQWSLIEPHIQGVNKHVTQLEQRYAPFKGYTPEAVQGLAEFSAAFDRDPVGQLVRLASVLQQRGKIDPDLDLEYLQKAMMGEWDDEDDEPSSMNGSPPGVLPGQQADPRDAQIEALTKQVQQLTQVVQEDRQTSRQRTEDAALKRQTSHLKGELVKAGYPEEALSDEYILSLYIANRGNVNKALEQATGLRTNLLKGFTGDPNAQQHQQKDRDLDLPKGPPKPANRPSKPARGRGMFKEVEAAAEQALRAADRS